MIQKKITKLVESPFFPDFLLRFLIRRLLKHRLKTESELISNKLVDLLEFKERLNDYDIALATKDANEQHYENPVELFKYFMGSHLKYSSCYWNEETKNLNDAEKLMIEITIERANICENQSILELGCGWGSMSLWIAKHYPSSNIVAVSNSSVQKDYIDSFNHTNLTVITADMNNFDTNMKFDRIISIEMFEHMRNWNKLLHNISNWLNPNGLLFIHIFTHKNLSYFLNGNEKVNWMAENFFKEGMFPSQYLLPLCNDHMQTKKIWHVNGQHYAKTLRAWLNNFDKNKKNVFSVFQKYKHNESSSVLFNRWRIFFIACEELFNFKKGKEWFVSHYLLEKK
jgi:cyclopropane-fatty-acyl-phospholipid synthase